MKYLYLLYPLLLGLLFPNVITGKVLDIDSKTPVIGANIEFGLNGEGTATDNLGIFFIESDSKQLDKLKISHIAYLDLEYRIKDAQKILIYLESNVINVDELVVTGTRTQKTFKDSPILTRIIHNQEIKESQSKNLYDVMNEIFPGYQKLKGEHSMSNEVKFNGLGTKSIFFMVDGQKVNAEFAGNMDLSVIDINNIEKIEYVDGSMSTLYGSGAMGGAINVITKKTDHFDFNINFSFNDPIINSGYVSSSYKLGPFNLFSSFNKKQSKGFNLKETEYTNPISIQKHQEEFEDISFNHKIKYQRNFTDYLISYRFYKSKINTYKIILTDPLDPFSDLEKALSFELPTNYNSALSLNIKSILNKNTFIDFNFGIEDYEKHYRYVGYNEMFWSGSYNKDASITINKNFNNGSHLFGANIINDKYISHDIDLNGDGKDFEEASIFENGTSKDIKEYSIFYNNELIINTFNVISGFRFQHHENYKDHLIPMISVCKKFEKYNLRSTWSKGYRAPNLKELYYKWEHPGGTVLGDPNLKPEESEYISLSLESLKNFYYSINIYHNSLKNMISYLTDGTTHTYTNFEEVTLNGINLFYKRKLLGRGELSFSYNYLDAYDNILKTRLDGSNYHNLNIKLSYLISDEIKIQMSHKRSSSKKYSTCIQNCSSEDESANIYKLSSFMLTDFSLRYNFSEFVSTTIGVNNFFDYRDKNATSEQFLTIINPGRTLFISFDYNIRKPYEK